MNIETENRSFYIDTWKRTIVNPERPVVAFSGTVNKHLTRLGQNASRLRYKIDISHTQKLFKRIEMQVTKHTSE